MYNENTKIRRLIFPFEIHMGQFCGTVAAAAAATRGTQDAFSLGAIRPE
jgi:hypothetical protein